MLDSPLSDILSLLAFAVFADARVAESELDIFKKAVTRISLSKLDLPHMAEADAHAWFNQNYANVRAMMSGSQTDFETKLSQLLDRIAAHAKHDALVHIIHMISLADGTIHPREADLISFVKRHWGVR